MEVKAVSKDEIVSPQNVAMVAELVRGMRVEEALNVLKFMKGPVPKAVAKTIKSAAANAENNHQISISVLKVVRITGSKGHVLKRFRPQARGRAEPRLRILSHINVTVAGEE